VPRPNAAIGAFEALLFAMLGKVVDWVAEVPADRIWTERGTGLLALAGILLRSTLVVWFQALSMLLIIATSGAALWLWSLGHVGVGTVAAATAIALRLNGMSHWVMWEFASLFEHIGTVRDGIGTLTRPQTVVDAPDAKPLVVTRDGLYARLWEHQSGGLLGESDEDAPVAGSVAPQVG
jgi:ABC-type multidrug transport system fused ATPase/permease subunit